MSTYLESEKEKNGVISYNIATLIFILIEWYFYFPMYAWCKILYRCNVTYLILIQSKNYTSFNVCKTLDNRRFLNQILICVYFLSRGIHIKISRMYSVSCWFDVLNGIFMTIKYMLYLVATDK